MGFELKSPTMDKSELKNRTKKFALSIIKLVEELPNTKAGNWQSNYSFGYIHCGQLPLCLQGKKFS
jgi:hypothetical protein